MITSCKLNASYFISEPLSKERFNLHDNLLTTEYFLSCNIAITNVILLSSLDYID